MTNATSAVQNLAALSAAFRKNMYPVVNLQNKNSTFISQNNTKQGGESVTNSSGNVPTTGANNFFTNNYTSNFNNTGVNSISQSALPPFNSPQPPPSPPSSSP